eukprot:m.282581 g.282581  ORF g.282581 m.282581 type:complete len:204 (+) comp16338_c1_seq2:321-932(+)
MAPTPHEIPTPNANVVAEDENDLESGHRVTSRVSFSPHPATSIEDVDIEFPHEETDETSDNKTQSKIRNVVRQFMGNMTTFQDYVGEQNILIQILDAWARGIGQVVFANNPISGVIITIGIFISSSYSGVYMLAGALASTLMAFALSLHTTMLKDGIYGFNGALIGIAVPLFHFGSVSFSLLNMILFLYSKHCDFCTYIFTGE